MIYAIRLLPVLFALIAAYYYYRFYECRAAFNLFQSIREAESGAVQARLNAAEDSLHLSDTELDGVLEHCGAGVLILSSDSLIERTNLSAQILFGNGTQPLVGKSVLEATFSTDVQQMVKQVRDDGRSREQEIHPRGSGSSILKVSVTPLDEENPCRQRLLLVAHDVTERRRLDSMRRDFVANVSHELRTPLASIRALAETLQSGAMNDPEVAGHFLETIINEAQRLTRISEDLLVLSRAESHMSARSGVNLSALVEEVTARLFPAAEKAGIALTRDVEEGLELTACADQLEQVLVNLVDNALKYTAQDGSVHVRAYRKDDAAVIRVSDTGIGIMSKDLPRIFERFYRVDKARSRQSGGTGLGLSIVKHIVETHGGEVMVESEYNRGTTFTVRLPILVPSEQAA